MTTSVATPNAYAQEMAEPWALITALLGGTAAMRKAGQAYLPKHEAESDESYARRLKVSTLYEAFGRTVRTMGAKPFAEPVKISEDTPARVAEFCQDIDLEGRDLQAFAHSVFVSALADGITHILVDHPKVEGAQTLADRKAVGARPYFVHIDARNVLDWRAERINGVQTLTQLRLLESVTEADGEWGSKKVAQIRVLWRDRYEIHRTNDKGEWVIFDHGLVSIGCIPLATVYTKRTGFMMAKPPLMGLADLNVEHWQSSSDQQNILRVARVPILFAAGFADGKLTIGSNAAVTIEDPEAKLGYVEHTGAAIGAGQDSLDKLEMRMSVMGMELLVSKPGAKTATESKSDTAESNSDLSAMVNNLEDSLALALSFAARWEELGEFGGKVELSDDFGKLDPIDMQSLVKAKQAGILSSETIFQTMQQQGMVDEEITWQIEAARLAADKAQAVADAAAMQKAQAAAVRA
jgi:hypothetical protein